MAARLNAPRGTPTPIPTFAEGLGPRDGIVDGRWAIEVDEGGEVGVDVVTDAGGLGVVVEDNVTDAGGVVEELDESEATAELETTLTDEATPVLETTSTDEATPVLEPTCEATLDGTSMGV